jgi:hypothetical protein
LVVWLAAYVNKLSCLSFYPRHLFQVTVEVAGTPYLCTEDMRLKAEKGNQKPAQ